MWGEQGIEPLHPFLLSLLSASGPHGPLWRLGTQRRQPGQTPPSPEAPLGSPTSCLPRHQPIWPSPRPRLPGQPALGATRGTKPRPCSWGLPDAASGRADLEPGALRPAAWDAFPMSALPVRRGGGPVCPGGLPGPGVCTRLGHCQGLTNQLQPRRGLGWAARRTKPPYHLGQISLRNTSTAAYKTEQNFMFKVISED